MRPRVDDFKVVSAVPEVGPAADDFHMTDGEVVIVSEVSPKMGVVDAARVLIVPHFLLPGFIVAFFLAGVVVASLVSVFVLGKGGERSSEKQCSTNAGSYRESFHSDLKFRFSEALPEPLRDAPITHTIPDEAQYVGDSEKLEGGISR